MAVTKIEERWQATWDDNLRLGRLADEVGIDFMLPIARWIGYGGETNFHEGVLDPVALAAALLAETERIFVFATIHTAFNHPLVAAKEMATVDQIGKGRAGLNIVAGWNKPEYDAMGIDLPQDHDDRYAYAQEWWEIVRRLWTEPGRYDIEGRFWQLEGVESMPKPFDGLLPILNAGSSTQGRDFAARNSNVVFTVVGGPDDGAGVVETVQGERTRELRPRGRRVHALVLRVPRDEGRGGGVPPLVCGRERRLGRGRQPDALQGLYAQSFSEEMLAMFRGRFAGGHGVCPLIGSPDDVAAEIKRFWDAGFGGMTLSFVDYVGELEYFAQEVLPRLEALGVRGPPLSAVRPGRGGGCRRPGRRKPSRSSRG